MSATDTSTITQEEIDSLRWFHEYDFPGGLKARSAWRSNILFHRAYEKFVIAQLKKIEFENKSVIDIGCWDGYYSFLARELGAKSVIAVDDYSQNWGTKRCFEIARQLRECDVDLIPDGSVYTLADRMEGKKFDIVLFLGVYYHLHAPYLAFAQLRRLCHESSIVVIEGTCYKDEQNPYARILLNEPHKSKFLPTSRLVSDTLRSCYLEPQKGAFLSDFTARDLLEYLKPEEVMDFLSLTTKGARLTDPEEADQSEGPLCAPIDRLVVTARPLAAENDWHFYKPPFGLDAFDQSSDRFNKRD